ncbi:hypothetical protein TWF192_011267 [Orbilia oligospora]|uniref:Uncharacterized protein n=1 Tax=Orbilia oligospora TaxID=2813651 RepID=A0A6G1LX26_ORBOL|nr:hypothetical protein TWF191_008711 [Orbilia oligospora]KAF3236945.1 hypothetical protein TWF192_011267 [Orbilia oligospora]
MSHPPYNDLECNKCGIPHPVDTACRYRRMSAHQSKYAAFRNRELASSLYIPSHCENPSFSYFQEQSNPDEPSFSDKNTSQMPLDLNGNDTTLEMLGMNHSLDQYEAFAQANQVTNSFASGQAWETVHPSTTSWPPTSQAPSPPCSTSTSTSTSIMRRPRNYPPRRTGSQAEASSDTAPDSLLRTIEGRYCARCSYPGCTNVMYSAKESKAKDNLFQHHQKKAESHMEWLDKLPNRNHRCRVTFERGNSSNSNRA